MEMVTSLLDKCEQKLPPSEAMALDGYPDKVYL